MPEPLTSLEQRIFDYLVDYVRKHTYQPSIREIGRRFEIKSTKTVSEHLQALADKGWVERDASRSRGVRLLGIDLGAESRAVPWYGAVAPEGAALRPEALLGEYRLDARLAPERAFLLSMRGHSLETAGFFDGDLLLIDMGVDAAADGDLVLARARGEVVVARLRHAPGGARLESVNGALPDGIAHSGSEFEVIGRIAGAWRQMQSAAVPVAATSAGGDVA